VEFEEEDDEVMIKMERGPRDRRPSETLGATKYRSRWMRRKPASTMASQTSLTWEEPEVMVVKIEAMNLETIAKEREKKLKADILTGTIRQERLKKQLEVLQEQTPGIGYYHECGGWHELPRSYSFQTYGRRRRRQHG
jgi:hypothetical protein